MNFTVINDKGHLAGNESLSQRPFGDFAWAPRSKARGFAGWIRGWHFGARCPMLLAYERDLA